MTRSSRTPILFTAALLLGLTACGADGAKVAKSESRAVDASSTTAASSSSSDGSSEEVPAESTTSTTEASTSNGGATDPTPKVDPLCRPGPGRTVTPIDDVEIEAVQVPAFDSPDEKLGDTVIPGVHLPAIDIPAKVVPGGCVVRYDAPGGCLGAVEISSVTIPAVRVPGAALEPVVVDGETVFEGEETADELESDQKGVPQRTEQVCRVAPTEGYVAAVFRPAVFRPAVFRPALFRPTICLPVNGKDQADECTESVAVESVAVDSVAVDSVAVDSAALPSVVLPDAPETSVLTGDAETAFVTPAAVLFDFDKFDLKPEATPTLQAIAAELQDLPADSTVKVDGHTDAEGTDAYNEDLSTKRADAVANWLRTEGGLPADRIATEGYGESAPAAPNDTEADRAVNRRVVVTLSEG